MRADANHAFRFQVLETAAALGLSVRRPRNIRSSSEWADTQPGSDDGRAHWTLGLGPDHRPALCRREASRLVEGDAGESREAVRVATVWRIDSFAARMAGRTSTDRAPAVSTAACRSKLLQAHSRQRQSQPCDELRRPRCSGSFPGGASHEIHFREKIGAASLAEYVVSLSQINVGLSVYGGVQQH